MTNKIEFTKSAINEIERITAIKGSNNYFRITVKGGGCSGFQYGFTFDDEQAEDDALIGHQGVRVLVDSLSYGYLVGSVLDYKEGLEGSRFAVSNPGASTTCGCGSSFAI